jgi:hypothetical protein
MCIFCGNSKNLDGFCTRCGEELCENCRSLDDPRVHSDCSIDILNFNPRKYAILDPCGEY